MGCALVFARFRNSLIHRKPFASPRLRLYSHQPQLSYIVLHCHPELVSGSDCCRYKTCVLYPLDAQTLNILRRHRNVCALSARPQRSAVTGFALLCPRRRSLSLPCELKLTWLMLSACGYLASASLSRFALLNYPTAA